MIRRFLTKAALMAGFCVVYLLVYSVAINVWPETYWSNPVKPKPTSVYIAGCILFTTVWIAYTSIVNTMIPGIVFRHFPEARWLAPEKIETRTVARRTMRWSPRHEPEPTDLPGSSQV
jgi:hypothetical protein